MKLEFIDITIQNFLSFGNIPTTFKYTPGIHAVTGNLVPNTTIRNGIGKTTLLAESLTYLLYGKTLRNINKDEIINTTNGDGCLLSGTFKIGDKAYKIERGIKPNLLKIWEKDIKDWEINPDVWEDDNEIQLDSIKHTQSLLEEKIKISFTCFTNMIILNVNHSVPFLSMDPASKRSVLEDILSLSIYGRMSDKAKTKHLNAKSDITVLENDLKNAVNTLSLTKDRRESLLIETLKFETDKQKRIQDLKDEIQSFEINKNKIEEKIKDVNFDDLLHTLKKELNDITIKRNGYINDKSKLETEIKMNNSVLAKLEHTEHCPLCQTSTNNPLITEYVNNLKLKVNDLNKKINEYTTFINECYTNSKLITEKISKLEDNVDKLRMAKNKIRELEMSIKNSNDNLEREIKRKLEIKEIISQQEYNKLENLVKLAEEKFNIAQKDFKYNKFIRGLLGEDGVRKYVTMKVLPILNKKVNFYLSMLGSDYTITFDSELKEKLIARNKDIRSYESFSGGEKKRIDLALLLALMDVSKERNSIDTNILVLDEVLDTSLDTVGAESFLEHLKNGFKTNCPDKCIYIISHKKELGEEIFDSIIHLIKKNEFTSIDKII
jgi:DNA repair exonuclease SbcCD ATPase subunit